MSTYVTDDPEGLVEGFQSVTYELEHVEGFSLAYFLVDNATGRAVSITIWESEDALNASSDAADELRTRGARSSETQVLSVETYEVAHRAGAA